MSSEVIEELTRRCQVATETLKDIKQEYENFIADSSKERREKKKEILTLVKEQEEMDKRAAELEPIKDQFVKNISDQRILLEELEKENAELVETNEREIQEKERLVYEVQLQCREAENDQYGYEKELPDQRQMNQIWMGFHRGKLDYLRDVNDKNIKDDQTYIEKLFSSLQEHTRYDVVELEQAYKLDIDERDKLKLEVEMIEKELNQLRFVNEMLQVETDDMLKEIKAMQEGGIDCDMLT